MTEASPEAVTVFPLLWYKFKTYASLQKPRADSLRTIAQHNQTETQYASYDNLWGHQNNKKAHKTCALAYMETEFPTWLQGHVLPEYVFVSMDLLPVFKT